MLLMRLRTSATIVILVVLVVGGLWWLGPFLGQLLSVDVETVTASEVAQVAKDAATAEYSDCVLSKVSTGGVPSTIRGSVSQHKKDGKEHTWHFEFYSPSSRKTIDVTTRAHGVHEVSTRARSPFGLIRVDRWLIDSEEAVDIARRYAEEEGKGHYEVVNVELKQLGVYEPAFGEENPVWAVEFFPPLFGGQVWSFVVIIDATNGTVQGTSSHSYAYI